MKNNGQSTVEYILLVTAVVSVVMIATMGKESVFQKKLNSTVTTTADGMQSMANRLVNGTAQP